MRDAHPGLAPVAVGLSVPGIVDEATGIGVLSSNLGWRDAPVRALAEQALGLPVAFGHDVRAAGEAEARLGAARGCREVVTVAIGTGIAGSIRVGGRAIVGAGLAGELGHTLSVPGGERCPCGANGCLETIASAGAIARRYTRATGRPVDGARAVLVAAKQGDPEARRVWDEAVEALAEQLARIVAILSPR
ncbi:ROK family protein [Agromyces marinus]|uniref:ROK family protein n=1 Tax=Agromyces marinus TaxID=1389020 RepID=UPI0033059243